MAKKYDAVILGFGKGGKTLAGYLAGQGKSVAIVEKSSEMYGGTCINVGCIPTKSLVDSAQRVTLRALDSFEEKAIFYKEAIARKKTLVGMLRGKNYHMLADQKNITIYRGIGSFLNEHEIQVVGEDGEDVLLGEQIFINTGSEAVVPSIAGLRESHRVYLSEEIMELETLPEELIIIGGGYIGLEFASMYHMFGAKVTVLQNMPNFIPREDKDISNAVHEEMARLGIEFVFSADIDRIQDQEEKTLVHYRIGNREYQKSADAVLVATGRRPNTAALNLAAAGVATLPNGGIRTDAQRRTSVEHIWAMGDVVGGLQFTYVSLDDFRIVKAALSGGSYTDTGRNIPYSVFIEPSLSRVGLTEKEAREQKYDIAVASLPAAAIPKAHVLQHPQGLLKAIVDRKTGKILGAALFCVESYEMINIIKLAMDAGLPYTALRDQIFTHPTMSEALNDLFGRIQL